MPASNVTLTAQWTALPNHTVTFNNNGGSGSMAAQTANVAINLTTNTFTRAGYAFSGWNTVAAGGGTSYANGASYAFTADVTLYAQWTANPKLATPVPTWPYVPGSNNDSLSWLSVANATGYKVLTCSGSNSSGPCTPTTQTSLITTTSYAPSDSNNYTLCIVVVATDSSNTYPDSLQSRRACVTRATGTYTHSYP